MNIAATQYTLTTQSLEIYISGCDGSCKGCHNLELRDYAIGTDYRDELPKIINKVKEFDNLIEWIWVLGGEPLLQDVECLIYLLSELKKLNKPIMVFTRFELDEVPQDVIDLCDYIKTGRYIEEMKSDNNIHFGIKLPTSNQQIHKLKTY